MDITVGSTGQISPGLYINSGVQTMRTYSADTPSARVDQAVKTLIPYIEDELVIQDKYYNLSGLATEVLKDVWNGSGLRQQIIDKLREFYDIKMAPGILRVSRKKPTVVTLKRKHGYFKRLIGKFILYGGITFLVEHNLDVIIPVVKLYINKAIELIGI